jgi:DNA-binding XRE family transcriptional regulator
MAKYKSEDIVRFAGMLGANLKYLRLDRKVFMPQKVPAAHIGVTHQQINKYESGKNIPCTYRLVQLADFFKVTPNDLTNPDYITNKSIEKGVISGNN